MNRNFLIAPLLLSAATSFAAQNANAQETVAPSENAPVTANADATSSTRNAEITDESGEENVVVVTATRTTRTLAQTTSAVTVITRQQLEDKKPLDLVDAIRLAPGVSISQSGTFGKTASIFLRGTNSNQTLVLLDGVRANSPADGRFDFGTVLVENIERIEIVRGPQSALYGSDALGGVINIITRRGGTGEFKTGGSVEFGSQSTNKQVITGNGDGVSVAITRLSTDGFFRNDDYRNLGASLRYDKALTANSDLTFTLRADDAKVGTPGQREFAFDPNARSNPREFSGSLQFGNRAGKRTDRVVLGAYDRRLGFADKVNPGDPFSSFTDSTNSSRVLTLDGQSSWESGAHTLTLGGELRRENAKVDSVSTYGNTNFSRRTNTQAIFAQDEWRRGDFNLVSGLRYENNSQFGDNLSGRVAGSYQLNERAKLKASIGTGFKAPSFNDLYFPNYGNTELEPEKSVGGEIGIEYSLPRNGNIEVTAFRNKIRNLITGVFVPPNDFQAQNVNRATTEGIEIGLRQPFGDGWAFGLSQTFLRTKSETPLLRRPRFNTSADLTYRRDKFNFDLGFLAQGKRQDNDFNGPPFGTGRGAGLYDGYNRFDFTVGYQIRPETQIFARLQNIADRRYEESAGFPAPRFNFVVGVQMRAF